MPTNNTFRAGDWGSFVYQAQRETWVYRADFGNTSHQPYYSYALHGIGTPALTPNWWNGNTYHCNQSRPVRQPRERGHVRLRRRHQHVLLHAGAAVHRAGRLPQRAVRQQHGAVGAQAPWDVSMGSNKAHIAMGWANVFIGDWEAPRFSNLPPSRGWYDDGPVGTLHYIAPVRTTTASGRGHLELLRSADRRDHAELPMRRRRLAHDLQRHVAAPTPRLHAERGPRHRCRSAARTSSATWPARTAGTSRSTAPPRPSRSPGPCGLRPSSPAARYTPHRQRRRRRRRRRPNSGVRRIEVTFNGSTTTRSPCAARPLQQPQLHDRHDGRRGPPARSRSASPTPST